MRSLALLLAFLGFVAVIPALADDIRLESKGSQSPNIVGDNNRIIFNDVTSGALNHLNDLLDQKNLTIEQKVAEAENWHRKYLETKQQLTKARAQAAAQGKDATPQIRKAQKLLHEGKLEEARAAIAPRIVEGDYSTLEPSIIEGPDPIWGDLGAAKIIQPLLPAPRDPNLE